MGDALLHCYFTAGFYLWPTSRHSLLLAIDRLFVWCCRYCASVVLSTTYKRVRKGKLKIWCDAIRPETSHRAGWLTRRLPETKATRLILRFGVLGCLKQLWQPFRAHPGRQCQGESWTLKTTAAPAIRRL